MELLATRHLLLLAALCPWPSVHAKGLVGKLPGNPASCPEEPCNSDPQHVLYALKWTSLGFGLILLLPLLMYYMSKLISKIHSLCSSEGANKKPNSEQKTNLTGKELRDADGRQESDTCSDGAPAEASTATVATTTGGKNHRRSTGAEPRQSIAQDVQSSSADQQLAQLAQQQQKKRSSAFGEALQQAEERKALQELAAQRSRHLQQQLIAGSADYQQQQQQSNYDDLEGIDHYQQQQQQQQQQRRQQRRAQQHRYSVIPTGADQAELVGARQKRRSLKVKAPGWGKRQAQAARRQVYPNSSELLDFNASFEPPTSEYQSISVVGQLYKQQLALPPSNTQHRHSIDGSILNKMAHAMQQGREQVNSIHVQAGNCDGPARGTRKSSGRASSGRRQQPAMLQQQQPQLEAAARGERQPSLSAAPINGSRNQYL